MTDKEQHHLHPNTMAFAKSVAQTIYDMAGADYQVHEDSFREMKYRFPAMMHAIIRFYGIIQGEYILSIKEETAAKLAQVFEEGIRPDELKKHREEYEGFVSEVVNVAAGQAIQYLKKEFEELTVLPGKIIYGEMVYPDIPTGYLELEGGTGTVVCCFLLNLVNLKIGKKLQEAWDEVQSKEQGIEQVRKSMKQIMVALPELNKTVDELFIIQNLIRQNPGIRSARNSDLGRYFEQLAGVSSKLRSTLMIIWSVPLQETFEKAGYLAEQLSEKAGKSVQVSISGGKTEIDRQADDIISEVLTHFIRNAFDHGIESPEERKRLGKPENGSLQLRSRIKGGYVIVDVEDDGRGLNHKRLVDKARKSGLIGPDEVLSDHETDQLIFHDLIIFRVDSRPTGLYEVKNALKKIRGSVNLKSFPGRGCIFTLRIPVAISTTEGMIVTIDSQPYIIPIANIRETLRPKKEDYFTVEGRGEMIRLRGKLLPLIRLGELFGIKGKGTRTNPCEAMVIVAENEGDFIGILADDILGNQEVVIQNLGEGGWISSDSVAGGSIMADGHVSLVLDIKSIFMLHQA